MPRVSICIPTKNAKRDLPRLCAALARQQLAGESELVVVDSSSSDGTPALLARAGARVVTIPAAEFGHGRTRNALARLAEGEIVVFLTQDAEPRDPHTLATLVGALDDPRTAGAFARLLPRPDDDPLTARTALDHPDAADVAWTGEPGAREVRFNDVASAIRRDVLLALPFPDVAFGEDLAWARAALAAGYRVRFEPRAVVLHAHRYTPRQAFERYRVDAAFQREELGRVVRPSALSVLKGIAHELRADLAYVARHGGWSHLPRAVLLRAAQVRGQRAGSRGPVARQPG
ncbi:MAG: glycosyltransferase [Planctomycetes bacterium]|nr:glycosyltransferase [Planctomycetota bacterium]